MDAELEIKERTNQRDGSLLSLRFENGVPLCPHCQAPMTKLEITFENSCCPCWWDGMQDATYPLQVVVAASSQDEFNYRTSVQEFNAKSREEKEQKLFRTRLDYAAGDADKKFEIIRDLRYLYGKRCKKHRDRVRKAIASGADFDQAMMS